MGKPVSIAELPLPTVTVIILASNESVTETIDSVVRQDYPHFDCIVVEDDSIIDFARVISPYCAEPRVSILRRSRADNSDLLNRAWRQAASDYVAIACSGDSFRANWLATSVEFLQCNPETIVGYPDWNLADQQGNALRTHAAADYDFYKMVISPTSMPGPGALIRKSAVTMPKLSNRSFRFGSGYEMWLLLALQGDFAFVPGTTAERRYNDWELKEQIIEYCRANNVLFTQAGLPKTVRNWRHDARVHVLLFHARVVAARSPWTAARLLATAFLFIPGSTLRMFLQMLAEHSRKLTRFGIPESVCGCIARIAQRCSSVRQHSNL